MCLAAHKPSSWSSETSVSHCHRHLEARNLENLSLPLKAPYEDQSKFLQLKTYFAVPQTVGKL